MVDGETEKDLKRALAPQHILDELNESKVIMIMPKNWPIVIWFNQVCDLMRYRASDGACLGLDLVQIETEASMSERNYTAAQFNGLRVMSTAAARAINKIK